MAVAEAIVICFDNSIQMISSENYAKQFEAIKLYCEAKFAAHPHSEVTVYLMGSPTPRLVLWPPTRDFQRIMDSIKYAHLSSGRLSFQSSITEAQSGIDPSYPNMQKRMLFITGGLTDLTSSAAQSYGKRLKKSEIAVDVVNFYLKDEPKFWGYSRFGKPQLNEFVTVVNSNDNSHIEHVQPGACIREVLFKSILKDHPRHPNENNKHKDVPIRFGISDPDIIPVA